MMRRILITLCLSLALSGCVTALPFKLELPLPKHKPVTGRAIYNVVPESAGAYFQKLECFCFSDQTIPAKTTIEFPVVYFVDPKFAEDFETKGKGEVTLSYTFFRNDALSDQLAAGTTTNTAHAAP